MKSKTKKLLSLLLAVLCMASISITAFASDNGYYASEENGTANSSAATDSIVISTENVAIRDTEDSGALTPDGNLDLVDDILQTEPYASEEDEYREKQFITVQTKNGNYFYLVIDRSGDTENVYLLNLVDEADLMALLEDGTSWESSVLSCSCVEQCTLGAVNTACEICISNVNACVGREVETETDVMMESEVESEAEEESYVGSSIGVLVLAAAVTVGVAVWWFKFRKDKPKTAGNCDLDDYDYGQDDEAEETELDDADLMTESACDEEK